VSNSRFAGFFAMLVLRRTFLNSLGFREFAFVSTSLTSENIFCTDAVECG